MNRVFLLLLVLMAALSLAACTTTTGNKVSAGINNPELAYQFNAPADN